jgi:hypothetical protein
MEFALWTTSFIVLFWELIARRAGVAVLARLVVCFVGLGDGAGIVGVDKKWGSAVLVGGIAEQDQVCAHVRSPLGWSLPQLLTFIRPRGSVQVRLPCNSVRFLL